MRKGKMPGRFGRGSSDLHKSAPAPEGRVQDSHAARVRENEPGAPGREEVPRPPRVVPDRKITVRQALAEMEARLDERDHEVRSFDDVEDDDDESEVM